MRRRLALGCGSHSRCPCVLHHDVWTLRAPKLTAICQTCEFIGTVLSAMLLVATRSAAPYAFSDTIVR